MGRHAVSSSLRTPAVLVGVPLATVLATVSTTAVLGGVVPSAQEAPLRAEAPGEVGAGPQVAVPQGVPAVAPDASLLDTSLLPAALTEPEDPAPSPRVTSGSVADARTAAGPRVVRTVPAVAPAARDEVGSIDTADTADTADTVDTAEDADAATDAVTPAVASAPRRAAQPQVARSAATAAGPAETVSSRSSDEPDRAEGTDGDGSVVDLGAPSGRLSVLTFG